MKTGHADKARELFNEGYNCSQAVLGAFAEDAGLDVKTALRLSAPFGGGMGRMREVCGGVSGMFMAIGLFFGYDEPGGAQSLKLTFYEIQNIAGVPIDHSFLNFKKELTNYGYRVGKISMKEKSVSFEKK